MRENNQPVYFYIYYIAQKLTNIIVIDPSKYLIEQNIFYKIYEAERLI